MILLLDYLGGANFASLIAHNHLPGYGAGFIMETNKPYWPRTDVGGVVNRLLMKDCPLFRLHGVWADDHVYRRQRHEKSILEKLERVNRWGSDHANLRWFFSPMCERDTDSSDFDRLWKLLEENKDGSVTLVNSVSKARYRKDVMNEFHGTKGKPIVGPYGYSTDGKQAWDQNVAKFYRDFAGAEYIGLWISHFNGKWNDKAKGEDGADVTARPNREAWPYKEVFPALAELRDIPDGIELSRAHIWKSHADQHQAKRQVREGKPVLITPAAGEHCVLRAMNGQNVGTMPRDGNYTDGRPKYRGPMWGFEYAKRARAAAGSPLVDLIVNEKRIGRVHPAIRAGVWR